MDNRRGFFITMEGGEGGGKTTNRHFLAEQLTAEGYEVVVTREPGGTPLAERIRELLLSAHEEDFHNDTELLLMFAARAQHWNVVIAPALAAGKIVLCDRFVDSSFAYQGAGRGLDMSRIQQLTEFVLGDARPDLTLIFDIPVKVGMQRAAKRATLDRIENNEIEFFERIRNHFLDLALNDSTGHYCLVDANRALDKVQNDLLNTVKTAIQRKSPQLLRSKH